TNWREKACERIGVTQGEGNDEKTATSKRLDARENPQAGIAPRQSHRRRAGCGNRSWPDRGKPDRPGRPYRLGAGARQAHQQKKTASIGLWPSPTASRNPSTTPPK